MKLDKNLCVPKIPSIIISITSIFIIIKPTYILDEKMQQWAIKHFSLAKSDPDHF